MPNDPGRQQVDAKVKQQVDVKVKQPIPKWKFALILLGGIFSGALARDAYKPPATVEAVGTGGTVTVVLDDKSIAKLADALGKRPIVVVGEAELKGLRMDPGANK